MRFRYVIFRKRTVFLALLLLFCGLLSLLAGCAQDGKKDLFDYSDWQKSVRKDEMIRAWEAFLLDEVNDVQKLNDLLRLAQAEQTGDLTIEYRLPQNAVLDEVILEIRALSEAMQNGDEKAVASARDKVSLAFLRYADMKTDIQKNSAQMLFLLFVTTFAIMAFFITVTALLLSRYRRSEKSQKSTAALNRQILAAQETERKRISLELHDTVAQDLRAVQLLTTQAANAESAESVSDLVNQILLLENDTIAKIRTLCYNLTPPDLNRNDLASALRHFCGTFENASGIKTTLVIAKDCDLASLSPEKQLNIFRIVQESLANAQKHARAKETTVVFRTQSGQAGQTLIALVTDDGAGFSLKQMETLDAHFGLQNMRERAKSLHGTLTINTEKGEGTEIRLAIPLEETDDTRTFD